MFGSKDIIEADLNNHFSRFEDPLWDDENAPSVLLHVKRISKKSGIVWKFFENKTLLFALDSKTISDKNTEFLSTVEGTQWLLASYKVGGKTLEKICEMLESRK